MKFGYLSLNNAEGIRPDVLAVELEGRGFDSIWMPEHHHIPASRESAYPGGGELPDGYWHMMDPFVSLQAAAAATKKLILATGICLLLEHDVLDLACTVATLDVLSEGRVLFGIGVGWNKEELANSRPDVPFNLRYSAMRERVAALRAAWTQEAPAFEGRFEKFSSSWVYPKPIQQPIPIALGNAGKVGIQHAAEYADHWCPIDAQLLNYGGRPDPRGGIELFRRLAAEAGRAAESIPISVFAFGPPNRNRLDQYIALGVERIVVPPPVMHRHDVDATRRWLDEWAPVMAEMAGTT